jgi:soluble cytochrome b562
MKGKDEPKERKCLKYETQDDICESKSKSKGKSSDQKEGLKEVVKKITDVADKIATGDKEETKKATESLKKTTTVAKDKFDKDGFKIIAPPVPMTVSDGFFDK